MRKFFKALKKTPMLIVLLLVLVAFVPLAIFAPGENKDRAIVMAIGLDKAEEEVEVSLLTFVPTPNPTYLETSSIISSKGTTVADALYKAQILTGKKIGLSHAKTTIVGENMLEEDITPTVDYLSRIASLSENTIFISTDGTAKDFLKASQSLGKDIGLKLDQLISYDVKSVYMAPSTLEAYYQGYYSPVKSSMIGYLKLEDEEKAGISSMESGESSSPTGGSSGGGSGSSSGGGGGDSGSGSGGKSQQKKQKIVNNGDVVLMKNGKKAQILSEKTVEGLNILNGKAIGQLIRISDVTDEEFDNAQLTYAIRKKEMKTALKMQNKKPIYYIDVLLGLELIEINGSEDDLKLNSQYTQLSSVVKDKIEEQCKKNLTQALQTLRKNKSDVIGLTLLFQNGGKEFRDFYSKLDDKEDILNNINFCLSVDCTAE